MLLAERVPSQTTEHVQSTGPASDNTKYTNVVALIWSVTSVPLSFHLKSPINQCMLLLIEHIRCYGYGLPFENALKSFMSQFELTFRWITRSYNMWWLNNTSEAWHPIKAQLLILSTELWLARSLPPIEFVPFEEVYMKSFSGLHLQWQSLILAIRYLMIHKMSVAVMIGTGLMGPFLPLLLSVIFTLFVDPSKACSGAVHPISLWNPPPPHPPLESINGTIHLIWCLYTHIHIHSESVGYNGSSL